MTGKRHSTVRSSHGEDPVDSENELFHQERSASRRKTRGDKLELTKNWNSEGKTKPIVLKTIRLPNSNGTRLMKDAATGLATTTADSDPKVAAVVRRGATVC